MKIRTLTLYSSTLDQEKAFYDRVLGLSITHSDDDSFTVALGWTNLTFRRSQRPHFYHYCFLIPSNKLQEALAWLKTRTEIITDEVGKETHHFDTWNADSFYFHDASGNIAECIVRYGLNNATDQPFDSDQFLCINEIGMPVNDIETTNAQLERLLGSRFWKGNTVRFGTHGSQEGLLLLPNPSQKRGWFPTDQAIRKEPFEIEVEENDRIHRFRYENGRIFTL
ncbi:MAG: glyoxalase [Bacteroidia bacterium]|nr:glyoxalase [Bacteroidia bacterium]